MSRARSAALPIPGADALAHSQALTALIARQIELAGGWLSFADYMNLALYAPGLGYYAAGARKLGAAGDFVTAPELTPLFGRTLAAPAQAVLAESCGNILELGAGSGRLALDLLGELARLDSLPDRYCILELSADLRQRQQALLRAELPQLYERLTWLDHLPERFTGLVIANEVLDALPVHLVNWRAEGLYERGVVGQPAWRGPGAGVQGVAPTQPTRAIREGVCEDQPSRASGEDDCGFGWSDRLLSEGPLHEAALQLKLTGPYLSEINLALPALIHSLAHSLERGMVLVLDYGFPRAEYYHPDRSQGTLMCHYRHHCFDDPFYLPGLVDITAHVDFTAVADAALEAGLEVAGFASQAHFLINCGLLDQLQALKPGSLDYLRQAAAVQKLVQPSEMGEFFKVMALAKGLERLPPGFQRGDRRHAL